MTVTSGATEPELLAYHFQEAGDLSAAFAYWIAAGDVAEQHGANQEAVAHYRSAKQLTERADLPAADRARVPEVLMKLGNAQMQMVGYHSEEVLQSYQEARDVALALDQQDEAAEAGMRMAPFLFGSCRHHDVMEIGNNILRGNPRPPAPRNARAPLGHDGRSQLPYRRIPAVAGFLGEGDRAG